MLHDIQGGKDQLLATEAIILFVVFPCKGCESGVFNSMSFGFRTTKGLPI